jgi:hypothetical protein
MAGIVLHYFDIYEIGEAIRLLLIHSRTPFVDHRVMFEEWPQLNSSLIGR